ncbi:MAG: aspartate--tRNA ligase [Nanoarchaeota archaeon]|nr:aspartate--tRNA ligase [Nanoarchaeota archaeon]
MLRTHTCGELRKTHSGKKVALCGWVEAHRVQGKLSFILLKDRYGITQIFVNPSLTKEFPHISNDSVIKVIGEVKARPENQIKKDMDTGEIELSADNIEILNKAEEIPLDPKTSSEETRLKYRYLDLRSKNMQRNLILRHKVINSIHRFLDEKNFLNIETPILAKSTPEGARDYLVPSRKFPKKFYALPQSPQIFKQLLMVSGYDKYYQIARCMRDEDLRSDRQPEFTQLDMEMSFVEEEDIYDLCEELMKAIFKEVLNIDLKLPFQRLTYEESIKKYKTDKPNLSKSKDDFQFLWVTDFPLFEYKEEEKRYVSEHHPFTAPKNEHINLIEKSPEKVMSTSYDLVLNGFEMGSGSIRINTPDLQKKIFKALKISDAEAEEKFGYLLDSMKYGAPPMGGIALGLDRLTALMAGEESIREMIAFPKNKDAKDLMLDSPSEVSKEQLKELGIK